MVSVLRKVQSPILLRRDSTAKKCRGRRLMVAAKSGNAHGAGERPRNN